MKICLLFLTLLGSLIAMAGEGRGGDRVGNGGDVINCPEEKLELLDLFQGRNVWGFSRIQVSGQRAEMIRELLASFSLVDPKIGYLLTQRSLQIEKELATLEKDPSARSALVKLTSNELINIADEGVAELPEGCRLQQAATQVTVPFPGEVKFTFQRGIWEALDVEGQVSLILHEVIYEHLIRSGEGSSRSTRYMNAALHAGAMNTVRGYFNISSLFGFRNIAIEINAPVRTFGSRKACSVEAKFANIAENFQLATTIMVNRRNVVTNGNDLDQALNLFWKKYAANGACD